MPRERAVEVLLRSGGFEEGMSVFALVHGSCQDAWVWHKVIPLLRADGHRVVAMDLPLSDPNAGASEYADAVVSALANLDEPPILVGHSMAGMVIPVVASRRPARLLVFLAAAIPKLGKSLFDRFHGEERDMFQPDWPGKDPSRNRQHALDYLFHDCDGTLAEEAITHLRRQASSRVAREAPPLEKWPTLPSQSIVCAEDRTLNPVWLRGASRRLLGVEAIEIPGGHCPFLSRPELLAAELAGLAAGEPA
jgi:pimeloyl-ACP methyl ester carboxylesterase